MSSQGALFNTDTSGVNPTFMWFGQVVDESTWVENHAREDGLHSLRTRDDFQGFGYRYKVRIFGRDLSEKNSDEATKDEELYMAEVSLPVTAGSGHGGSVQTPNLRQGNYVFGFYKDGIEATEPIIFGLLPNHAQTRLFGGDPEEGFAARTGGNGLGGPKEFGNKNILAEGPDGGNPLSESAGGNYVLDMRDRDIAEEQRTHHLPKTYDCDARGGGAIKSVMRVIEDIQGFINKLKAAANTFAGQVSDILDGINSLIQDAALLIADVMKGVIDKMRGFVENAVNKTIVLPLQALVPPNNTSATNEIAQLILDIIACIFNKIIKGLVNAVLGLLSSIINKLLGSADAAFCAAQSFMSNLLGGILGPIASGLSSISGIVDGVLGAAGGILGAAFSALDAILGIIAFLTCDEDTDCSAGDGWSFWYGDGTFDFEVPDLSNAIKTNAFSGAGKNGGGCDNKPKLAKPPKVKITGGGGVGASANAIISNNGDVIGFDIIDGGNGYTTNPTVTLSNDGPGSGGVFYARLDDDDDFLGGQGGETSGNPESNNTDFSDKTIVESDLKINVDVEIDEFMNLVPDGAKEYGMGENFIIPNGQVYVGGTGGTPIREIGVTLGNPITYNGGNVTVNQTSLYLGGDGIPVVTNSGPLLLNSVGGIPVKVGGKGGTNLTIQGFPIKVEVQASVFDFNNIPDILQGPFKGTFTGRGGYEDGKFNGTGTLTGKDANDKDFNLLGSFSGFDANLVGSGLGTFAGEGSVRNGRFSGEGVFVADSIQYPYDDQNDADDIESDDQDKKTLISNDGKKCTINPDGTATIQSGNQKPITVLILKVGGTGGTPVTANGIQATVDGDPVFAGGKGGDLLLVKRNISPKDKVLDVNGQPVKVSSFGVTTGGSGIPLIVGGNLNNTQALVGKTPLTAGAGGLGAGGASDNKVVSAFDIGSQSDGKTAKGTFAGPDGSSVKEIIVVDSGSGYLNRPDGSIYSNGVKISDRDGTIILTPKIGYNFYPPNTDVLVNTGDLVFLPPGTDVAVYDNQGNELQRFTGLGLEEGILIEEPGTLTTPVYDPGDEEIGGGFDSTYPTGSNGAYPIILKINDILIANPGINYSPDDNISIEPSNGAVLEPVYNRFGKLTAVNIVDPGIGFIEKPKITIKSNTGINAIIIPIFGALRVGDLSEIEDFIPQGARVLEVIDCVGKINRSR